MSVKMPKRVQKSLSRPLAQRVIGKIRISGPIMASPSRYPGMRGIVTPDSVLRKIQFAQQRGFRAVIFEINSPGGAVVASKEIADAIKESGLRTVAWIRDIGASGAYWVASVCERIVADPCSGVGSIGVIGQHIEVSELMKKYGVRYEGFKSGEFKDMGVPFRKTTAKEKKVIQDHIDELHKFFVNQVAANRGIEPRTLGKYADGRVFMGEEAKRIGLVDFLGGRTEAIRQAEISGNFRHAFVYDIEDLREEFMFAVQALFSQAPGGIGRGAARELLERAQRNPGSWLPGNLF
jgi:protease-4